MFRASLIIEIITAPTSTRLCDKKLTGYENYTHKCVGLWYVGLYVTGAYPTISQ